MPIIADLSDSHLLNPSWMPHAKFHLAWLLSSNALLAIFSLYLAWVRERILEAGIIGILVMGGFWVATLTQALYGGMLADPNLEVIDIAGLHPNVFAFMFVSLVLAVGIWLHTRASKKKW